MDTSFSVDTLFRNGWTRYKERILAIIFTSLLGFGIMLSSMFGLILVGVVLVGLILVLKMPFLYIFFIPMAIGFWLAIWYLGTWVQLASVRVITDHANPKEIWNNFREAAKITVPFMVVGLIAGLFMIGLWYTYIFIIPLILWMVWVSFMVFVYLDEKKGGLYPLWRSREIIQKHFMGVLGRLAILWVLSFAILFVFNMTRYLAPLGIFVQLFLVQPLTIIITYEMYKSLKEKHKPGKNPQSTSWLVVSIIGWVFFFVIMVALMSTLAMLAKDFKYDQFMDALQGGTKNQKLQPPTQKERLQYMQFEKDLDQQMEQYVNIEEN